MNAYRALAAAVFAILVFACAAVEPQQQSAERRIDKDQVTGSRTRSESAYVRSVQGKPAVDDMMQKTSTVSIGKTGP